MGHHSDAVRRPLANAGRRAAASLFPTVVRNDIGLEVSAVVQILAAQEVLIGLTLSAMRFHGQTW